MPVVPLRSVHLGGLDITVASRAELVSRMVDDIDSLRGGEASAPTLVFDANGHGVSLAATNTQYRTDLFEADLIHADGAFLVSLSRLTPTPIPERSATTDLIYDAAAAASELGFSFYLLGATEDVNRACAETLLNTYPGLTIAGRRSGYFDDLDGVADDIRAADPDVLWVGMGKPLEQRIAVQLRDQTSVPWIVTCGGCFNFVVGAYRRAPTWMQRANLEWLHRLWSDPRKLFWRYAVTSPHAVVLIIPDIVRAWSRRSPRSR